MKVKFCSWRSVVWIMMLVAVYVTQVGSVIAAEEGITQEQVMTLVSLDLNDVWNESVFKFWNATRIVDDSGQLFYKIPSLDEAHPHYVRFGVDGKINLAKITVDFNNQSKITQIFKSLGEPEIIVGTSKAEMMYGFPSKGYGFVINEYSGSILKLVQFAPKTKEAFMADEGKAYQAVDIVVQSILSESQVNLVENTKINYVSIMKRFIIAMFMISAVVVFSRRVVSSRKKHRT